MARDNKVLRGNERESVEYQKGTDEALSDQR